jgi:hypothetical protein
MSMRVEPERQHSFISHSALYNHCGDLCGNCGPYHMFVVGLGYHEPDERKEKGQYG